VVELVTDREILLGVKDLSLSKNRIRGDHTGVQ